MIWFDVLIFAAVAAFLGWRLYTVLGERNSDEPTRIHPFAPTPMQRPATDAPTDPAPMPVLHHAPDSLAGRLAAIQQADPAFNEKSFLTGAKAAFSLIVTAFAAEDTPALRPLLSDDVYDSFSGAIRARQLAKEKLTTKINRIKDISVEDASLVINTARVTLRIVSEQVQVTYDADGHVLSGDPTTPHEVIDIWTFSRNTRALDPNWHLAETRSGE